MRVPLLAILCLMTFPAIAQDEFGPPVSDAALRAGVVFERDLGLTALMRPGGGVEAVDIGNGETVWVSDFGDKPILMLDDRVLTQREDPEGALVLATVELKTGEPLQETRIELPEGVVALIDDTLDRQFEIEAQAVDGSALVRWTATFAPVAAVQRLQTEPVVTEGVFRLGPDLNGADDLDLAIMAPRFAAVPPDLTPNERLERVEGVQFRSTAGEAVLSSEQFADNRTWANYRWSIYDRETGELLGVFEDFQRVSKFAILPTEAAQQDNPNAVTVLQEVAPHTRVIEGEPIAVPLSVRAIDLRTGDEIWTRPVRDTTYRGPLPH